MLWRVGATDNTVLSSPGSPYWVIPATLPKPLGLVITRPNLSFSFIQYAIDRFKIGTVKYRVVNRLTELNAGPGSPLQNCGLLL